VAITSRCRHTIHTGLVLHVVDLHICRIISSGRIIFKFSIFNDYPKNRANDKMVKNSVFGRWMEVKITS
jgi:hypothetical protein